MLTIGKMAGATGRGLGPRRHDGRAGGRGIVVPRNAAPCAYGHGVEVRL